MTTYDAYALRGGIGVSVRDSMGTHSFGLDPWQAVGLAMRLLLAVARALTVERR